jgi:hypothetical protein
VEEAFEKLKQAMVSTPVVALPNFSTTFIVEMDASDYGIGAIGFIRKWCKNLLWHL